MTSKTLLKINNIVHCQLTLEDGSEFTIPMRNDGYIHATKLCKVGGKLIADWLRQKEVKNLINIVEGRLDSEKSLCGAPYHKLAVEVNKGNSSKYTQGTWVHPDLGIHLSQWINPAFALQVSKWVRELIFTDEVRLGHEKSEAQIIQHYENIIEELNNKIDRSEQHILGITSENRYLLEKYKKITYHHNAFLRRKKLYKLKEGACIYLINMIGMTDDVVSTSKIKIGITGDITNRVSGYRTSNPFCKLMYLAYTHENSTVEKFMKTMYQKNLEPNNSEFISDIPLEDIRDKLEFVLGMLNVDYTVETDEELEKFNGHNVPEDKVDEIEVDEDYDAGLKRCGGFGHKDDDASRMLPRDAFFRNASTSDGYARICKECYLTLQYGDDRKRRKVVTLPTFDTSTHKWCNLCETVRLRDQFYNDKMTKDGLGSNCKECKRKQKIEYMKQKKGAVCATGKDGDDKHTLDVAKV
jgi:hypothetical protein